MVDRKELKLGGIIFIFGGLILLLSQLLAKSKGNQVSKAPSDPIHSNLETEYNQVNDNFREFMNIRFKLLGFLPTLGGVAVFVLSFLGLSPDSTLSLPTQGQLVLVAIISLFGFLATLGIIFYDQRNSELYNALIHRAKYLETLFHSPNSPGAIRKRLWGGQFQERPSRGRSFYGFFKFGHDTGLAFIYGPIWAAWLFPLTISLFKLLKWEEALGLRVALLVTLLFGVIFTLTLIIWDYQDSQQRKKAGKHAILVIVEKKDGKFEARIPVWPDFSVVGETKKDVLTAVRKEISSGRIIAHTGKTELEDPAVFAYYL